MIYLAHLHASMGQSCSCGHVLAARRRTHLRACEQMYLPLPRWPVHHRTCCM